MTKFEKRVYSLGEVFTWDDPEWMIDGLVHRGSSVFLSGPPKTGKSLFALRLAAAVSSGSDVCGHKARKGKVVYLAAERARLMKPRAQALMEHGIAIDPQNFVVFPKPLPFVNHEEVVEFAQLVGPTDLLIVDTLRRCFEGGRENDNNDMTRWATGVELFCEITGAAAIVIHHNHREYRDKFNRPMESDYAGGGSLLGSLDGQFSLRPREDHVVEISVTGANEGNYFHAFMKSIPAKVGEHVTWVMIDGEHVVAEQKPDLDLLIKSVLISNPGTTLADLADKCREDERIRAHWPDLDNTTVGRILKKWRESGKLSIEDNPTHRQQKFHTWIGDAEDLKTTAA